MFKSILIILFLPLLPLLAHARVIVGVIDTGIDLNNINLTKHLCDTGHKAFVGESIQDLDGHGSHVASNIIKYAKDSDYCLLIVKYYDQSDNITYGYKRYLDSLEYLVDKADIINFSGGGDGHSEHETNLIQRYKGKLFTAVGNDGVDLNKIPYWPAYYGKFFLNVIAVGMLNTEGRISSKSNYGNFVKDWEVGERVSGYCLKERICLMTGSSMSTAIRTGKYIYEKFH